MHGVGGALLGGVLCVVLTLKWRGLVNCCVMSLGRNSSH